MKGYPTVALGEFFRIKHGFAFKGEYFSQSGDYVLLTPGNFNEQGGLKLKGDKEKYYVGEIPQEFVLKRNDLIVAMTDLLQAAPILGASATIPEHGRFLHNQRLGKVVDLDNSRLDRDYLFFVFNYENVRAQIKATATGATVKHTAPDRIYAVKAPVPRDIAVQRKIASVLSTYDDLIENNTKRIKILEEMARSLYREWFVNFRFPGHEKTKFVNSSLGKIPDGWHWSQVGDNVLNFDSKRRPLSSMQRAEMKGEYAYFGAAKIIDWVNDYIFDGRYLLVAEDGSVVTDDRRPVLQIASGRFWVNNHTHILQGRDPVSTDLLFLRLSDLDVSPYITGAAQPKITQANLNRIPMILPQERLLQSFDHLVGPLLAAIETHRGRNEILRKTRDLLLPRLISGEIDVSSLPLEPAAS
jgi:type I restriction enzyme S subunit